MDTFTQIFDAPAFSLDAETKHALFTDYLNGLTKKHYSQCEPYQKIIDLLGFRLDQKIAYEDLPFLPVRLFKQYDLVSVDPSAIIKTMTSSGTTGQQVSKIYLDRPTAAMQTRILTKITTDFIGKKRLPLLIIDSKDILKNRQMFSARGAGILGFSIFGRDTAYALDSDMKPDLSKIESFLEKHQGEQILLFGFTFMVWQFFLNPLSQLKNKPDLTKGILIHGGGWKKLSQTAVDNETFKSSLKEHFGITRVHNYYGMVEQTGSIFMECEQGHLHCSNFSDIMIRDKNFKICWPHEKGMIQLLSLLPESYPGHNLLTEDSGEILGEDNCPCGRKGKYFKVHGRISQAEIRGCSDTVTAA